MSDFLAFFFLKKGDFLSSLSKCDILEGVWDELACFALETFESHTKKHAAPDSFV